MPDVPPRDFAAEIASAMASSDKQRLAAIAIELNTRLAAAERSIADAGAAEAKRLEKQRERKRRSRLVTGQGVTVRDSAGQDVTTPAPSPSPSFPTPHITPTSPPPPGSARKTAAPAGSRSWLDPICAVWESHKGVGSFRYPKAGRLLKPLRDAGHSAEQIAANLDRYLRKLDDPKFASLARFAETYSDHSEFKFSGPPIVNGWFSDEVERSTRPPGMVA